LRINFFNKHFKRLLPELYKHFEAVDLTTDLYLIDWMLTLFTKNMDLDLVSRIWDNFLLDGEIFAMKTGLAILILFESKFLKETHFKIIEQLKDMHNRAIDE
jgi:hypothetical protein